MNAVTPLKTAPTTSPSRAPAPVSAPTPALPDAAAWDSALAAANAWRGAALQCFARAETSVTELLLVMAEAPERGPQVKLQHLVGPRFDGLAAAIAPSGPFAAEGKTALPAVEAFRAVDTLRVMLAHANSKVTLDRGGRWTLVMRVVSFRARKAERTVLVIEEKEAKERLADLALRTSRLTSELGRVRSALKA